MMAWLLPALLGTLILARILLAATLAPGRDELAYWYWAWHGLDASYSLVAAGALLHRRFERFASAAAALLLAPALLLLRDLDPRLLAGIREFGRFSSDAGTWERLAWTTREAAIGSGPAVLLAAGAGAVALRKRSWRAAWPGWRVAALLFLCFVAFFLDGQAKGNWFLPSLVLLVPLGAASLDAAGQGGALRAAAAVRRPLHGLDRTCYAGAPVGHSAAMN